MTLLAALCVGTFVFLLVAQLSGNMPERFNKVQESKNRHTRAEQRQSWLNQSGAGVTPLQFWSMSIGISVTSFLIIFALTSVFIIAAIPSIMIGLTPRAYYARKRLKGREERVEAWPDAIRTLIAGISSSQSLHQSLRSLATGGPMPLRPVFQKYSRLTQALDQRSALEVIKEELADPMSDRIIEILISATEAGPGVVLDILRDLADATTRDLQLREHLETMQTEQKLNARIVFIMPYVLLILMVMSSAEMREFYKKPLGVVVILIGTGFLLGGMVIIRKLGVIPTEQRVFSQSAKDEIEKKVIQQSQKQSQGDNPMELFS